MRERGFLDDEKMLAVDLIKDRIDIPLISVKTEELVSHAIDRMRVNHISQIPVTDVNGFVGSLEESDLFGLYFDDKDIANKPIKEVMGKPFPIVKSDASIEKISKLINRENSAVLVDLGDCKYHIITKHDVIRAIQ